VLPRIVAAAHGALGLEDLPVFEVVPAVFEMLRQVVWALVRREPMLTENPASSSALRFAAESLPASATTTISVTPWRVCKASNTGMSGSSRLC
jgi:hypothetical protein